MAHRSFLALIRWDDTALVLKFESLHRTRSDLEGRCSILRNHTTGEDRQRKKKGNAPSACEEPWRLM
jgi:hypothetical protein